MPLSTSNPPSFHKWLSRLGWVLVLLGALFFTPAADLLPLGILSVLQPGSAQTYYRVVPVHGEPFVIQPALALVGSCIALFGFVFIAVAKLNQKRSTK
jgi:hypothetical protein